MKKNYSQKSTCRIFAVLVLGGMLCISPFQTKANTTGETETVQQNRIQVSGTVVDSEGNSVLGASVSETGTTNGTMTDYDGKFTLTVSPENTLTISYIGYETKVVSVGNKTTFNITLQEDVKLMDEVVVVGFATQKKVNLTGAVGIAKAKDIESRPVTELTQALQGLVPGLEISKNSGSMEKGTTIKIRGIGTIGDGTKAEPLVLIDGVEADINSVNPQDVDNISVLKDAASSSIYGPRGAFGVILITTKSGKAGKTSVNYNNNFRWSAPVSRPHMMDSWSFMNYFNEAHRNTDPSNVSSFLYPDIAIENALKYQQGLIDGPYYRPTDGTKWDDVQGETGYSFSRMAYGNTDWYDIMYKDWAFSQEHNISTSGGSEKFTFYVSLNYMDQSGILKVADEGLERYSLNGKFTTELAKWAKLSYSARFMRKDYSKPVHHGDGLYENLARQARPNLALYDNNGNLSNAFYYPKAYIEGGRYSKRNDQNFHQMTLVMDPIKNWVTTVDFNFRNQNDFSKSYSLPTYNYDAEGTPYGNPSSSVGESTYRGDYLNGNARTQYSFTLNEKHNFSTMGGIQLEEYKEREHSVGATGIINLESPNVGATTGVDGEGNEIEKTGGGRSASWSNTGFFGRINYDYEGKYLAEINLRYDGSSRYRADQRWKLYPSTSLGWNIAREDFMKPVNHIIDMLKVRASWGSLGNQNVNNWYPTYLTMEVKAKGDGLWMQNGQRPATSKYGNPIAFDLTWETITTWNAALDWGLLNNRLTGSFDAFIRTTSDMVGKAEDLPAVYGQTVPKRNNTTMKTTGFEFEIMWRDQLKNGLSYSIRATIADARNKITDYPNDNNSIGDWRRQSADYRTGLVMGELWGYETIGIAKSQAEMDAHLDQLDANYRAHHGRDPETPRMGQSSLGSGWGAGDIMYRDLNGDGIISAGAGYLDDHGDIKVIGNTTPRYMFSFDLNGAWKGFDVRAYFQGVMKRDYWTNSCMFWGASATESFSTAFTEHMDYFREDADHVFGQNLNAYFPRPSFDSGGIVGRNRQSQTRYLQDASYIRLKNLQVGYTLPAKMTKEIGIERCRIYVSGENLWTGTNLHKMFDPETIDGGKGDDTDWRNKNNGNAYPISKVFSMGVSVTF